MKLPKITDLNLAGKKVLVRCDLDIPVDGGKVIKVIDDFRLKTIAPTINYLLKNKTKIILIGHRGRPMGVIDGRLSLAPVAKKLEKLIKQKINFVYDLTGQEAEDEINKMGPGEVVMLENLRFDNREGQNDSEFAKRLASFGDFYINESFADSHRQHASVVALPQQFKSKNSVAAGFNLQKEVEVLSKVLENPDRPVVIIIGGAKTDKAKYVDKLLDMSEWVLVGGLLPRVVKSYCRMWDGKSCIAAAHLTPEGRDIDIASATNFSAIVANAGTIVWNGPMGEYEKEEFKNGTEIVAKAVVENDDAFKVVGGGDTIAVLKTLGILEKMNWVSTGGGAMLEYLAYGDLPGLKALRV